MRIKAEGLTKRFGDFEASKEVSFEIEDGKLIGFLGPSGGGKTTILRMLAGLETPDAGDIFFDGRRVNDLLPQSRGIGFVFQNYALFRHMTVFDNIAFGLTVQKRKKQEIAARVSELLELTGLRGLEKRLPHQLSGGQRQRVAFARALAPQPQLLLLDEPFAAIDAKVRKELRTWLKEMIGRLGITTIFVTHDQEEAVEVADEIMIIHGGRLEQQGTPLDIYRHPRTPFVAGFVGETTVLDRPELLKGFEEIAREARAVVRPEFVEVGTAKELSYPNASERGVVRDVYFRGKNWQVDVELDAGVVTAYRSLEQDALRPGDEVWALVHRIYAFEGETCVSLENAMKSDPMPVYI